MRKFITLPKQRIRIADDCDVLVAGGGPAGISAAIAAARSGAKTRLIEVNGCLGGVWTAGLLSWMFEMDQPVIAQEITRRLERRGARIGNDPNSYTYDIEEMKLLLEEMCEEAGVEFQLHTRVTDAVIREGVIRAIVTESKSGKEGWAAVNFIDASGDGDLASLAGCGFDMGKGPSEACQPMTYMALVTVRDANTLRDYISFWSGDLSHRDKAVSGLLSELHRSGVEPSYAKPTLFQVHGNLLALMINHEYGASAIDAADITRATVNGRAEVHRAVKGLQELGGIWSGIQLVATCEHIGVREGRRVHGLYTVTQDDLASGRRHDDAVCTVHYGVDIHCTKPTFRKIQEPSPINSKPYDIPMRALISRDVPNILMAGRCISGDFIAHSSYRVTGAAVATGQAAGAAAALSVHQEKNPAALLWSDIEETLKTEVFDRGTAKSQFLNNQP